MNRHSFTLLFFILLNWGLSAQAALIGAGQISGYHIETANSYAAGSSDSRSYDYSTHEAHVTTDGIKLKLISTRSGFYNVTAGIVDSYLISGGTPGEMIALMAQLKISGDSRNGYFGLLNKFHGRSDVNFGVGLKLHDHPLNAGISGLGNPVIDTPNGLVSGQFGVVHGPGGEFQTASTDSQLVVGIDATIDIPLLVTVGQQFDLAVSVGIDHAVAAHTNMLSTATLGFILPDGYAVSSVNGFNQTVVPVPAAIWFALTACLGLLGFRRQ